jgi:hypothetical protein
MNRRRWLRLAAGSGVVAALGGGAASLWLSAPALPIEGFRDTAAALRWLDALTRDAGARSLTPWPLAQVIEHAAQSVEYSIDGYPALRNPWFRASVGALAFRTFSRVGRMQHDTLEPIPGAPALVSTDLNQSAQRLHAALQRFEAEPERMAFGPHFAFGTLGKSDYRRAHLMHLADHAREISSD